MGEIIVSERERLDLIQQGDHVFLEAQERLYDAKKQRAAPESNGKVVTTLDTFTVYGSLDEVTELYLSKEKKMVLDFSESRELAVLKPNTVQRPLDRTSLRWSLSHSPSRLLAKDQDFCYLEIMKPYGTADGRRGWARVSHSIKHKACPEFTNSHGLNVTRAVLLYCGLFFEETDALGVLNATVFYNIRVDKTPSVLMPMVQKARGKRTIELVNHYVKMSNTILKSRKISLTRALQLQGEKRCAACANHLSRWKPKDKCVMCGSYLCDKCSDIVTRNYRVDVVAIGQIACFSCAHRRGKKIVLESEDGYSDLDSSGNSGSAVKVFTKTHSILESDQEGGLRDGSISSLNSDEQPKWFDDEGKPSLAHKQRQEPPRHRQELRQQRQEPRQQRPQRQEPRQQNPQRQDPPKQNPQHEPQPQYRALSKQTSTPTRSSEFIPHQTFFLPTDHEEQQRRRCNTRVSTRRPAKALDEDFIARRRSKTTGNSRLSSRAKPTGCAPGKGPSRPKESPITFDTPIEEPMDFAPVGTCNQVGLNLEELNYRMRRYTTNAIPVQPMDWTDQGARASTRCHTVDGIRKHERYQQSSRMSARPSAPAFTPAMMDFTNTPSARYSKQNPCDLSYLASFK